MAPDLSQITINRIIVHDLPRRATGDTDSEIDFSERPSALNNALRLFIRDRVVETANQSKALPSVTVENSSSPVPTIMSAGLSGTGEQAFVDGSKDVARALFERHNRAISAGLLAMVEFTAQGAAGICIIKLDRQTAIQLQRVGSAGNETFDLTRIPNLVLNSDVRVQKAAVFVADSTADNGIWIRVIDHQATDSAARDIARFWMQFLGVKASIDDPAVATQKVYLETEQWINESSLSPTQKIDTELQLQAYIAAPSPTMSVTEFAERALAVENRDGYLNDMQERGVPAEPFEKDSRSIKSRTGLSRVGLDNGVYIMGPSDKFNEVVQKRNLPGGQVEISVKGVMTNINGRRNA